MTLGNYKIKFAIHAGFTNCFIEGVHYFINEGQRQVIKSILRQKKKLDKLFQSEDKMQWQKLIQQAI